MTRETMLKRLEGLFEEVHGPHDYCASCGFSGIQRTLSGLLRHNGVDIDELTRVLNLRYGSTRKSQLVWVYRGELLCFAESSGLRWKDEVLPAVLDQLYGQDLVEAMRLVVEKAKAMYDNNRSFADAEAGTPEREFAEALDELAFSNAFKNRSQAMV